jgi:hypothetical protein
MFDLVGRDGEEVRNLYSQTSFDLTEKPYFAQLSQFGFVSGKSTHADRVAGIKTAWEKYQVVMVFAAMGIRHNSWLVLVEETINTFRRATDCILSGSWMPTTLDWGGRILLSYCGRINELTMTDRIRLRSDCCGRILS